MHLFRTILMLFLGMQLFAGHAKKGAVDENQRSTVRIVPMQGTPEPENVILRVSYPESGEVLDSGKVQLNFRLRGFSLGTSSQFRRASELIDSKYGQTVHIVIDDKPYFAYAGPSMDPFDEDGDFYQQNYRVKLPSRLSNGMHVLRMFPCRSYGESLKCPRCFQAVAFFVKDKKIDRRMNLRIPFLTYNEPNGSFRYPEGDPILLDFWVSNCELSSDGYKVRLMIDGEKISDLTEWRPYYLYGLRRGSHRITLQLLDTKGNVLPGVFNDVTQTIHVK